MPQLQLDLNTTMIEDYLITLRVNKSGKLKGEGGRFLSKVK